MRVRTSAGHVAPSRFVEVGPHLCLFGLVVGLSTLPVPGFAQSSDVEAREAEMFGKPEADAEDESTSSDDEDESETSDEADEASSSEDDSKKSGEEGDASSDGDDSKASSEPASAREAEMFGGSTSSDESSAGSNDSTADRIAERLGQQNNSLSIGGTYFGRLQYSIFGEGDPEAFPLSQPNILDLYLDARPTDRLRLFTQGRLTFDPTVRSGDRTRFGGEAERIGVELDQLWLKFDVARTLYVTVGRQHVRWGVGRFWFPNDFLFARRRDPVAIFDERTGVDLLRLHLPIPSLNWNLYAVANLGGASSPEEIGGALRAEFLLDQTEGALSATYRKDRPLRLGFDVSTGVWWFDLRGAVSIARGVDQSFYRGTFDAESLSNPNPLEWELPEEYSREDDWIPRALAGAEISLPYGGEDTLLLGAEYFFNDFGYDDPDLYPWLIVQGNFRPFYVGRHYGALYAALPSPGQWDDVSLTASTLANLSDPSFLTRLDVNVTVLTHLTCFLFGSVTYGRRGEFNLRIDVPEVPAAENTDAPVDLSDGVTIPAIRGNVGLGVQMDY